MNKLSGKWMLIQILCLLLLSGCIAGGCYRESRITSITPADFSATPSSCIGGVDFHKPYGAYTHNEAYLCALSERVKLENMTAPDVNASNYAKLCPGYPDGYALAERDGRFFKVKQLPQTLPTIAGKTDGLTTFFFMDGTNVTISIETRRRSILKSLFDPWPQ